MILRDPEWNDGYLGCSRCGGGGGASRRGYRDVIDSLYSDRVVPKGKAHETIFRSIRITFLCTAAIPRRVARAGPSRDHRGIPRGRAASPVPHRPQCTGKPLEAHTACHTCTRHRVGTGKRRHRHRERPTRVPASRAAADPKPSPVPIQSRLVNAALRTQVSGCHGQRTMRSP